MNSEEALDTPEPEVAVVIQFPERKPEAEVEKQESEHPELSDKVFQHYRVQ